MSGGRLKVIKSNKTNNITMKLKYKPWDNDMRKCAATPFECECCQNQTEMKWASHELRFIGE